MGFADASFNLLWRYLEAKRRKLLCSGNCQCNVSKLMPPGKWRIHHDLFTYDGERIAIAPQRGSESSGEIARRPRRNRRNVLRRANAARILLQDGVADDAIRLGMLRQRDNDSVGTDD